MLLDAVLAERQVRLESIDPMTNRAGIMLGFTGAIVALTGLLDHVATRAVAFIPAAMTVWYCLQALDTVLLPGLKPVPLRKALLMQPPDAARLRSLIR